MRSRLNIIILLFVFLLIVQELNAFGKKELEDKGPVNTEWILCITTLDTSELPRLPALGESVARSLAGAVSELDIRFRGEEEAAYYRDYAWAKSRADAAKALQTKRNERDLLLYKGDASWKYRKNLKTVDDAISKLEDDLAKINALAPVVEERPVLTLNDTNRNGTFPKAPNPGGEYGFCTAQKADAFLSGTLSEYHGRIFLNIKMYTVHTRSYSFEESLLFSSEYLNEAIDEISTRLSAAVSETLPSGVLVHVSPSDAIVLIDGSFVSQGELHNRSPGEAEITVRADNYLPVSVPLELNAGELAEFFIDLSPLGLAAFNAEVPGSPGSKVFLGGLYAGEAPLRLELPRQEFSYISVETPEGEVASMVYRDNSLVKGSAHFVRAEEGGTVTGNAIFSTKPPISPEEKRVERARRGFYGAYGTFWVILPLSLITAGVAQNYLYANNHVVTSGLYSSDYETRERIFNNAQRSRYITIGAYSVMGAALGVTFFQIFRYLYVSGGDATPIVKSAPQGTEP